MPGAARVTECPNSPASAVPTDAIASCSVTVSMSCMIPAPVAPTGCPSGSFASCTGVMRPFGSCVRSSGRPSRVCTAPRSWPVTSCGVAVITPSSDSCCIPLKTTARIDVARIFDRWGPEGLERVVAGGNLTRLRAAEPAVHGGEVGVEAFQELLELLPGVEGDRVALGVSVSGRDKADRIPAADEIGVGRMATLRVPTSGTPASSPSGPRSRRR